MEGFLAHMYSQIVELLQSWVELRPVILRSATVLGTPETVLRSNLTLIRKVYDYTQGEANHTRRAQETLHLIPFMRIVMPRLSFVSRFGRLYEHHPRETFTRLVLHHRETRRHLRDVENFRARPNVPIPNSRFGRHAIRPAISSNNENNQAPTGRRVARPNTSMDWVDEIAEVRIPNHVNKNNKINLMTLEPINRGVRLGCGHWVTKSTLQGMVKTRRAMVCPFCRRPIQASNFPSSSS